MSNTRDKMFIVGFVFSFVFGFMYIIFIALFSSYASIYDDSFMKTLFAVDTTMFVIYLICCIIGFICSICAFFSHSRLAYIMTIVFCVIGGSPFSIVASIMGLILLKKNADNGTRRVVVQKTVRAVQENNITKEDEKSSEKNYNIEKPTEVEVEDIIKNSH